MIRENNKYINIILKIYLMVFCILKLFSSINVLANIRINTSMFTLGLILLVLIWIDRIKRKEKPSYSKWILIFILSVIVNFIFNFDIDTMKTALFEIFYVIVIYDIAYECVTEKYYINLLKTILIISFILTFAFLINYIIEITNNIIISKNAIAHIFFQNINCGALIGAISIIFLMYLYKTKEIKFPMLICGVIYFGIFIIVSKSRTSILALVLLGIYYLYNYCISKKKKKQSKKTLKYILIGLILILSIFFMFMILRNNYLKRNNTDLILYNIENKAAKVTTLRYWLWKNSIKELFEVNPIFGLKYNFGENAYKQIKDIELLEELSISQKNILARNNLHNGFIEILVRNGIFGFVTFMYFFITFLRRVYKFSNKNNYLEYVKYLYVFYILINIFENNLVLSNSFFVIFLWVQIGKDYKMLEEYKEKEEVE